MTLLAALKSTLQFAILLDAHLIYFRCVQPGFMSLQERILNNAVSIYSTRETEEQI